MTVDHVAIAQRLRVDQPWRRDAACIGRPDVMDPHPDEVKAARRTGVEGLLWEKAKAICRACPVLVQCRSWATTLPHTGDVAGVCGGLTEDERASERRRRNRALRAIEDTPSPGTHLPCSKCGDLKPDAEFALDPRLVGRRGRASACRDCKETYRREWRRRGRR